MYLARYPVHLVLHAIINTKPLLILYIEYSGLGLPGAAYRPDLEQEQRTIFNPHFSVHFSSQAWFHECIVLYSRIAKHYSNECRNSAIPGKKTTTTTTQVHAHAGYNGLKPKPGALIRSEVCFLWSRGFTV